MSATTKREQRIQELVATAPPLNAEQLEKLRLLLAIRQDIDIMRRDLRQVAK